MRDWQSQAHVKHYCKYHIVFVPKYRKKAIYGNLRRDIGGILRVFMSSARRRANRGVCDERSYSYVTNDPSKI